MHGARISIKIKMKYLSKALDFNLRETFPIYTTNNTKNILKFLQKVWVEEQSYWGLKEKTFLF